MRDEAQTSVAGWSPQNEALYQQVASEYDAALARGGRRGVQGMPVAGAVEGGSIYRGYAQPAVPAVVTAPPAPKPAATPKSAVGTTKYVNNVPYVLYPDGQWYKIKQK
jgi:hypothetical protein